MTDEQLAVANAHADKYCTEALGYPKANLSFIKGYIECLSDAGVQVKEWGPMGLGLGFGVDLSFIKG
jgi:hypothetical protein